MLKVSEHVRSWFAIRLQCFFKCHVCGVLFLYAWIVCFGGLHKLKFSQKACSLQKHACASATKTTVWRCLYFVKINTSIQSGFRYDLKYSTIDWCITATTKEIKWYNIYCLKCTCIIWKIDQKYPIADRCCCLVAILVTPYLVCQ